MRKARVELSSHPPCKGQAWWTVSLTSVLGAKDVWILGACWPISLKVYLYYVLIVYVCLCVCMCTGAVAFGVLKRVSGPLKAGVSCPVWALEPSVE